MIQDTHWSSVELGPDPGLLTIQSSGWPSPGTALSEWPNVGVGGSGQKVMWRSPKTVCLLIPARVPAPELSFAIFKYLHCPTLIFQQFSSPGSPARGADQEPPNLDLYSQGTRPLIVSDNSEQEVRPNRKTQPQLTRAPCTSCYFKSRLHSVGVRVCVRVY